MPAIQLFVEDQLNEAYEILAAKAMEIADPSQRSVEHRQRIRAARVTLDELTKSESLLDLAQRSLRSGYHQVVFAIDHEGPGADSGRVAALSRFRAAFQEFCDHQERLPDNDPLKQLKVVRLEVHSCLETWLLSDPQAIVASVGGSSDFRPDSRQTDRLTPREARDQIAHIVREVGRRRNNRRWKKLGGLASKSLGTKIAPYLDLAQARRHNSSLDYFCDMIGNNRDGCLHPFPSPE